MTINTRAVESSTTAQPLDILALYRTMVTARVTNDLLKTRKTQGKFPFYIGCAGHESMAAVVAASLCSGIRAKNSSCAPLVMAESLQTTSTRYFARPLFTSCRY